MLPVLSVFFTFIFYVSLYVARNENIYYWLFLEYGFDIFYGWDVEFLLLKDVYFIFFFDFCELNFEQKRYRYLTIIM